MYSGTLSAVSRRRSPTSIRQSSSIRVLAAGWLEQPATAISATKEIDDSTRSVKISPQYQHGTIDEGRVIVASDFFFSPTDVNLSGRTSATLTLGVRFPSSLPITSLTRVDVQLTEFEPV